MPEERRKAVETIFKILFHTTTRKSKFVIRIMKWDDGPVILEKRQILYNEATKEETIGRCRGLLSHEWRQLFKRGAEISAIFAEHDAQPAKRPGGFTLGQTLA